MTKTATKRVLPDLSKIEKPALGPTPDQSYEGGDFRSDFQPCGVITLMKGRDPLVSYVGEYKGKYSVHIRSIYKDTNDVWCPGKGVSIPAANAKEAITALYNNYKDMTS